MMITSGARRERVITGLIRFYSQMCLWLPVCTNIVFESESDLDDNPRAIYDYLLTIGFHKRHK